MVDLERTLTEHSKGKEPKKPAPPAAPKPPPPAAAPEREKKKKGVVWEEVMCARSRPLQLSSDEICAASHDLHASASLVMSREERGSVAIQRRLHLARRRSVLFARRWPVLKPHGPRRRQQRGAGSSSVRGQDSPLSFTKVDVDPSSSIDFGAVSPHGVPRSPFGMGGGGGSSSGFSLLELGQMMHNAAEERSLPPTPRSPSPTMSPPLSPKRQKTEPEEEKPPQLQAAEEDLETRAAALGLNERTQRDWKETALPPTPSSPSPTFSPPGSPRSRSKEQPELTVAQAAAALAASLGKEDGADTEGDGADTADEAPPVPVFAPAREKSSGRGRRRGRDSEPSMSGGETDTDAEGPPDFMVGVGAPSGSQ